MHAGRAVATVKELRGDLDAILSKALDRDPARRYPSAAMQADLQNYLDQRPVIARVPSTLYRTGKFLRRNAVVTGLCGLLCTSMLVGELLGSATAALHDKFIGEPLVEASMLGLIADTYDGLGRYAEGLAASNRQLALLRANGGSRLETGHALTSQGEVLREQGRWNDAEPVMRAAVTRLRPEHNPAELASALDILGIVLMHVRQQNEAEKVFLEETDLESHGGPTFVGTEHASRPGVIPPQCDGPFWAGAHAEAAAAARIGVRRVRDLHAMHT